MADETLSAALAEIKANAGKFYVYVLSKPDRTPFYVGCGAANRGRKGHRIQCHEWEAARPVKSPKASTIRMIKGQGLSVVYAIDSWHADLDACYAREIELIGHIGRRDLGTGPLTNLTAGGDGVRAAREELRRKQSEMMTARFAIQENRDARAQTMRSNWADPAIRARMMAARQGRKLSAEHRANVGRATVAQWNDPDIRARRTAGLRAALNKESYRQARRELMRKKWADPDFRAAMMAARKKAQSPP
jgi:hypothetical protein